jgi:hypothetical protein
VRTHPTWPLSWPARVARGLWPDRNPLRRPSDRAEAGMVAVLIMAFLIGAPFIALIAWRLAVSATFTSVDAQHAGWRQVPAVLLIDAPASGYYDPPVPATWTAPDGARCRGTVYPNPGAQAGTTTPIWVNPAGQQMAWPLTPFQATSQADVIAGIVVPFWAMLLWGVGMLGRRLIDTRRMAAWDADLRAAKLSGPASASP